MASLGKDLARIRKEQGLTLEEVHEDTKIPNRIIESIENGSIFTEINENTTYIRSFVRSYAKALSIDEKQIVYALDKVEKGEYGGSLQSLLKEKPKKSFEFDEGAEDKEQEAEQEPSDEEKDEMVHDHSPEFNQSQQASSPAVGAREDHPDVQSVDWADMGRRFQPLKSVGSRTWASLITLVILAAIVGGFFFFYDADTSDTEVATNPDATSTEEQRQQESSTENLSTDSLELNIASPEEGDTLNQGNTVVTDEVENENLTELPDTLSIVIYAAYGQLEPVRVYTDISDDINPYWVEEGEALRFNFVNEIRIRGQYSRMVLLLNGHPIEDPREAFYNADTRLLEITRSYFEDDDRWLQAAPDSLPIDAPPPSLIRERPTFN
ncbi:MAG: helix-turn-helix domain-containing protein [Bacteroidota bacterium]